MAVHDIALIGIPPLVWIGNSSSKLISKPKPWHYEPKPVIIIQVFTEIQCRSNIFFLYVLVEICDQMDMSLFYAHMTDTYRGIEVSFTIHGEV